MENSWATGVACEQCNQNYNFPTENYALHTLIGVDNNEMYALMLVQLMDILAPKLWASFKIIHK